MAAAEPESEPEEELPLEELLLEGPPLEEPLLVDPPLASPGSLRNFRWSPDTHRRSAGRGDDAAPEPGTSAGGGVPPHPAKNVATTAATMDFQGVVLGITQKPVTGDPARQAIRLSNVSGPVNRRGLPDLRHVRLLSVLARAPYYATRS